MTATQTPPAARPRTWGQRALDRICTRVMRLPAETHDYTIARDVRIRMRDDVELLADHYAPVGSAAGTILVRSPYGWSPTISTFYGGVYAGRGYHVVLARCRGTFGSGGAFEPMIHEVEDGADTVAWLREQAWFGGRFATLGASYLGFTQWSLLMDPPPELATAIVDVGPHDFHEAAYQGGAFNLNDFLGWSEMVAHQEDGGFLRSLVRQLTAERRVKPATKGLSLVDAGGRLLAGRAPWYRDWVSHRDPDDPFWARMRLRDALDRVHIPMLLQTGWQDLFLQQTLEQYTHLRARGIDVAMTAGPWTHMTMMTKGGRMLVRDALDWLAEHLAETGTRARPAPVKIFVTGAREWRALPAWPPATREEVLHLHPGGALHEEPTPAATPPVSFEYDPADPTPTVGGRLLAPTGGYRRDDSLAERADVLVFIGAPLGAPLEVVGSPVVELAHTTDNPHADLFVRLSEVDDRGRSRNVSEGFVRLDPAEASGTVRLELDAIAHRFAAGNRIRLVVAGGSHPRWERNLGTNEDPATSSAMKPSRRTIELGSSRVVLPGSPLEPPL